ncbi:MAG TPA: hypothetical protein VM183_03850 [Burkholderiales bacterium]|nr:hypothetical protein [Burkholderiales bacterium]
MIRAAGAFAMLLVAGPVGAQLLSHRLDTLKIRGVQVLEAELVQGELRGRFTRGWLRRR